MDFEAYGRNMEEQPCSPTFSFAQNIHKIQHIPSNPCVYELKITKGAFWRFWRTSQWVFETFALRNKDFPTAAVVPTRTPVLLWQLPCDVSRRSASRFGHITGTLPKKHQKHPVWKFGNGPWNTPPPEKPNPDVLGEWVGLIHYQQKINLGDPLVTSQKHWNKEKFQGLGIILVMMGMLVRAGISQGIMPWCWTWRRCHLLVSARPVLHQRQLSNQDQAG